MIGKLRRKFILVNMICVMTILLGVLFLMDASYYRITSRGVSFSMENDLNRTMGEGNFKGIHIGKQDKTDTSAGTSGASGASGTSGTSGTEAPAPPEESDTTEQTPLSLAKDVFSALLDRKGSAPPDGGDPRNFLPNVIVKLGADNSIVQKTERELSVDDDNCKTLVAEALAAQTQDGTGFLKDYGLRFMIRQSKTDGSTFIIFADNSFERNNMKASLIICIVIFVTGFILFFVLSLFLSRWALNPVEKAWKQQSQFVADASHELKTPITVILANLDIIGSHRENTVASQSRWIESTKDEAVRMKQLIQDLLFLAKSDANKTPVVMSEIDFSNCITAMELNFESVAFEKKVDLESSIADGLKVRGNEGQLKQLITILLDNAVKYAGPNGKVVLRSFRENEKVVVSVNNTGETIAPEEISHIFERFYRTDKSRSRKEGGYGLGLSIADNIVRLHKGSIRCESSAEKGTTFTAELPCA